MVKGAISIPSYPRSRAKLKAFSKGQSWKVSLQMANCMAWHRGFTRSRIVPMLAQTALQVQVGCVKLAAKRLSLCAEVAARDDTPRPAGNGVSPLAATLFHMDHSLSRA